MDLTLSDEQQLLIESTRAFFERECPVALVRHLRDATSGHSPELWRKMADQGWLGLAFPEEDGGGGGSLFELGLVMQEAGRALVPTTFRSSLQAGLLVAALGTPAQRTFVSGLVDGRVLSTLAIAEPQAIHDPRFHLTEAVREGESWTLSGTKSFVPNADLADPLLVLARIGGGPDPSFGIFAVPTDTPGVDAEPKRTFAHDRQFTVRFDGVRLGPGALVGGAAVDPAGPAVTRVFEEATALLCAEMVGGATKVLEMTTEYVQGRVQFGRPIGSFQAVQHHLADLATGVTGARLTTYQALWRLSEGLPATREVAVAKAWTGEAYKTTTVMAHQLQGGMGYVLESDLHLWSEHAKACELALGPRDRQLRIVAQHLDLPTPVAS